jgi:diphosphomevalonate decarboxylase
MHPHSASATAHPNIAFIKYWGNRDDSLRMPANGSISMNLDGLFTRTSVQFESSLTKDELLINGKTAGNTPRERVSKMLAEVRQMARMKQFARVESRNNFPTGTGIASSASSFAALALAASAAAGLDLEQADLSRLARHGSGSACRSIPGGFVEWSVGGSDADSIAVSFAPPEHWDLADCIAVVSTEHKRTGSSEGHALAATSLLQPARLEDTPRRLAICRKAILDRDFAAFAGIVEEDSDLMHAVMMTSHPPLFYWQPATLTVMEAVRTERARGLPVCYTIDAGPNVHVICTAAAIHDTTRMLRNISGVREVRLAKVGGPARLA